jgi:hypothetical protein
MMHDLFIAQDLYTPTRKKLVRSDIKPLTCYICKKELDGISITARVIENKTVFLCSHHYMSSPQQIVYVN